MKYIVVVLLQFLILGCQANKVVEPSPVVPECKPKVVVEERVIVEEKPVIQEKIVYKDKIVYRDKVIYKDRKVSKKSLSSDKIVIGRVEYIHIVSANMTGKAKIDTGAKTTSIDAKDIVRFERDGKEWVKFKFAGQPIEKPLIKNILIKRHGAKSQRRPVVQLRLKLGEVSRNVNVTLTNRDNYIYPILIGRNFLKDTFVVDVSQTYTVNKKLSSRK